ncbi:argininosuccinate synthase [Draconibacterium orientale]|uniref:argininosuccinate synthase n=1 Tax=Draconibacterium orientale TaxID=1168034 RepID=X5DHA4_9BACT|nr:argininosuccinate synthase domain-containing protein [Draconibacterium orientale]AHW59832.1 argininosuccinate synthase [Draconibacterium orientale]SET18606.1 argininosuccinate synthase [Draconibacterium orientale]
MSKKLVLAFSGGLDTSFCVKYLKEEKGYDVYTAIANTGGFSDEELKAIEERALALGAVEHITLDVTNEYYEKCIRYMVFGNVLRNNTYPISVSSERAFQAIAIIEYAKEIGAKYIAHGSTGAGNDQIRFDLTFQVLAPEIEIITPTRDMLLTRQYEIDYLKKYGFEADFTKMEYSINQGLWGTSVGGKETLTTDKNLHEEAYPSQLEATEPKTIELGFEKGELVSLDGEFYENGPDVIRALEAVASKYAIGRDTHVGDTIIGIKGRVGFEAAAPLITIKAHHLLEKHTLTKWQSYWKEQLGNWYGMFLHEAMYQEPVMRNIEDFLESTQENVTGKVIVKLRPYNFELVGIESEHDLMNSGFGQYGETVEAWTADDVKGFTKILSNSLKIYNKVNGSL